MFRFSPAEFGRILGAFLIMMVASTLLGAQEARRTAKFELAPIVKGLNSTDASTLRDSAFRLSQLTPAARILLPAEASTILQLLTWALGPANLPDVRQAAAYGLASITPYLRGRITSDERDAALSALANALDANNPDALRAAAAWATTNLTRITGTRMPNQLRSRFLDDLRNLLASKSPRAPGAAAEALGSLFRNAGGTVATGNKSEGANRGETEAAFKSLVDLLKTSNEADTQTAAINALGNINYQSRDMVSLLAQILMTSTNLDARIASARVLGELGFAEDLSGPALSSALLDSSEALQITAASALATLGAKTAPIDHVIENLGITLQQDDSPKLQENAAWALGRMGLGAESEAGDLMDTLESETPRVRRNGAWALGQVLTLDGRGSASRSSEQLSQAQEVCRRLMLALKDVDPHVRSEAAGALAAIAARAQRSNAFKLLPTLTEAEQAIQDAVGNSGNLAGDPSAEQAKTLMVDSISALQAQSFRHRFLTWANNRWVMIPALVLLVYLVWFVLLRLALLNFRPLLVLRWNEALKSWQALKLPGFLSNLSIPVRHALLVGFYHYHDRVLNAWVNNVVTVAGENFKNRDPGKQRSVWVSLPAILENETVAELTAAHLLKFTNRKCWRIRLIGEGGSGKTALACQLGLWGMHEQPEKRISPEIMLPVVLGPNSSPLIRKDITAFTDGVRRELQILVGSTEPIPKEFIERLLRKKRILVILDGISEMPGDASAASQDWDVADDPEFPVNALVLTSRTRELFSGGLNVDISPVRIDTNHLLPFMNAYLANGGQRLDDITLYESCRRLAAMVGSDRGVTPLMARLYAEQMMTSVPLTDQSIRQFPRNVPELVLAYLNVLNQRRRPDEPDNPTLHQLAKIAAWECLRQDFRPSRAPKSGIAAAFEREGFTKTDLQFLERSVGLIRTIPPEEREVYFLLDSLADYLGAMRIAELCQSDEDWKDLLERCRASSGFPGVIAGFLTALADYCEAKQNTFKMPRFVSDEIAAMLRSAEGGSEVRGTSAIAAAGD